MASEIEGSQHHPPEGRILPPVERQGGNTGLDGGGKILNDRMHPLGLHGAHTLKNGSDSTESRQSPRTLEPLENTPPLDGLRKDNPSIPSPMPSLNQIAQAEIDAFKAYQPQF